MMKDFDTGLKDIKGREIKIGDKIQFLYVDPMGRLHGSDVLDDRVYTVEFRQGCVVAVINDRNPKLLRDYMKTKEGEYIPNYGTLVEYVDDEVLCVVVD
jgi:hypothetical protein